MPAKNPRREALASMRQALGYLRSMISTWNAPPSLRWYDSGDGRGARFQLNPRRRADIPASEYQENDPEKLRELMRYMAAINQLTINVYTLAEERLAEIDPDGKD